MRVTAMITQNDTTLILTINAGSSSLKFAAVAASTEQKVLEASIVNIGTASAVIQTVNDVQPIEAKHHADAAKHMVDWLSSQVKLPQVVGVGHRIVHGGPSYYSPQPATNEVLETLHRLEAFDPEHLPAQLALVKTFRQLLPHARQVLCFDTAFHHDLPVRARRLAVRRQLESEGVRRYGFHGLSYEFIVNELRRTEGEAAVRGKIIVAHLGSGASLVALKDGKPIDTTMSMTPASGIMMSSRSGDVDPGLFLYLARTLKYDLARIDKMMHFESGLLGVSETSADMKELLEHEGTDERAREAVELFCYQVKKTIGSFAAALGGVDRLIFTGGMGENAPKIRSRICREMEFLGIKLNDAANQSGVADISAHDSNVKVQVLHTDEAITIMRHTAECIASNK